jgi:curved DNA-binding protein CbpA
MKDYYKILRISRYASETEIKKAYRELALKYHPDKTSDPGDHSYFNEINEAYQVLGKKSSREDYNLTFDYWRYDRPRQTRRYETTGTNVKEGPAPFRRAHYRPPSFYKKEEEMDLTPYVRSVRIISGFTFVFVFLIVLDYFLPFEIHSQVIQAKLSTYNSYNSVIIATEKYNFPLSYENSKLIYTGDKAKVELSPIFNIPQKLVVDTGLDTYIFKPHYSIYNVYSFFLVILLGTSFLGTFHNNDNPELVFSAGVANVFLTILIIFLIHIS